MKVLQVTAAMLIVSGALLSGCGSEKPSGDQAAAVGKSQPAATETSSVPSDKAAEKTNSSAKQGTPADFSQAAKDLKEELDKGKNGGKVDWSKAEKIYKDQLKPVVAARDSDSKGGGVDDHLEAAMKAGKDGQLSAAVVDELHEKLLLKVAFYSLRKEFKDASDHLKDKAEAKSELDEAKGYYDGLLKPFVEKRDKAYGTTIADAISGAMSDMNAAVDKGDSPSFSLARQVVDKSIMKAFYLAVGADKGYGYKLEKLAKDGTAKDIKAEQAEAWAYFQSLIAYLSGHAKEDADFINSQFDLTNDPKKINGDRINQAFVRAFALTAKSEYGETFENWGKEKSATTAMEGLMFINIISGDLANSLGGEDKGKALIDQAQKLLNEVKSGHKDQATELFKQVEADLNKLAKYGK